MEHNVTVESLFAQITLDRFLAEKFGKEPYHSVGPADRFLSFFDWRALNQLLTNCRWAYPRFRLVKDGYDLPPGSYSSPGPSGMDYAVLSFRDVVRHIKEGASLVVDAVDEIWPPARRLAESLERTLGEYVKINAYASWTREPGFDHHWDDHDVIIVQIFGSKRWSLFGEGRRFPLRRDVEPNITSPSAAPAKLTVDVKAGHVLHVPRGYWHSVSTVEAPSLHLTLGITQKTAIDYLHWVADHFTSNEFMRRSLPRYSQGDLADHVAQITRILHDFLAAEASVNTFLEAVDVQAPGRQHFGLPGISRSAVAESLEDATIVWLPARFRVRRSPGEVLVEADGHRWRFHAESEPLIRALSSRTPIGIDDLASSCGHDGKSARFLVADLILEGLAATADRTGTRG